MQVGGERGTAGGLFCVCEADCASASHNMSKPLPETTSHILILMHFLPFVCDGECN